MLLLLFPNKSTDCRVVSAVLSPRSSFSAFALLFFFVLQLKRWYVTLSNISVWVIHASQTSIAFPLSFC